jgi:hypothetical protein
MKTNSEMEINKKKKPTGWLNDLWKYNTTSNTWTWVHGSCSKDQPGKKKRTNMGTSFFLFYLFFFWQESMAFKEVEHHPQFLVEDILLFHGLILKDLFGSLEEVDMTTH